MPPARATSSGPIVISRPLAASATIAPTFPTDKGSSPVSTACTCSLHALEGAHQLARHPKSERVQFDIERLRGRLHRLKFRARCGIVCVEDDGHLCEARHHLLQQLDSFCPKLRIEKTLSSDVSARPHDAGDDAVRDRIAD